MYPVLDLFRSRSFQSQIYLVQDLSRPKFIKSQMQLVLDLSSPRSIQYQIYLVLYLSSPRCVQSQIYLVLDLSTPKCIQSQIYLVLDLFYFYLHTHIYLIFKSFNILLSYKSVIIYLYLNLHLLDARFYFILLFQPAEMFSLVISKLKQYKNLLIFMFSSVNLKIFKS